MNIEIEPDRVYKLWHFLELSPYNYGVCVTDLQKDEGTVYLVAEWQMTHDGEIPRKRLPLDERFLVATRRPGEFKYLLPIRTLDMAKLYGMEARLLK